MAHRFNDILVIDDLDNSSPEAADLEDELAGGGNETGNSEVDGFIDSFISSSKHHIKLIKSFCEAGDEIIDASNRYNLIVFDLDMRNGFNDTLSRKKELDRRLREYNIDLKCGESNFNANDGYNGIYLYLLLLSKGFPSERMVILTGNRSGTSEINRGIKGKCGSLYIKDELIHIKDTESKMDIDNLFFSDEYYRIRRLVFHACSYWRDWLKEKRTENIPFNRVYNLRNDAATTAIDFIELLDHIEMMFPVLRPDEPEKVYYQAAKSFCSFHESKANLENTKNNDNNITNLTRFHSVPRSFRNWSAHNKFKNNIMTAEEFALIFCITLRSYFDEGQNEKDNQKKAFKSEILGYENDYWSDKPINDLPANFQKCFFNIAKTALDGINQSIKIATLQKIKGNCDFWAVIFQQGMDNSWKIPSISYVFFPLLFNEIKINYPYLGNVLLQDIDHISKDISRKIHFKENLNNRAGDIYKIISGTDKTVQSLFLRQAFKLIKNNRGKE